MSTTDILYVMAVDAEYGGQLRQRISPLLTGVGPVEAAVAMGAELAARAEAGSLPDVVVSLGSAGSRRLAQGEVYQVTSVSYRDMDATAIGVPKGQTPFLDLPVVVELPHSIPGIPTATLSTGGAIISGPDYDAIEADMVDMETFAVLRACQRFAVPLIGLRGISDGATELTRIGDWADYLPVVDERLAEAVDRLERSIRTS